MNTNNQYSDEAYNAILNEALSSEPDFKLSENFADNVSSQINRESVLKQYLLDFLNYLMVFVGLGILTLAIFYYQNSDVIIMIKAFIKENYTWLIGCNVLLLFVLFVDKVLLRYAHFKFSKKH